MLIYLLSLYFSSDIKYLAKGFMPRGQITRTHNARTEARIPVLSFYSNANLWSKTPQQQIWMYTRNKRLFLEVNSKVNENQLDAYTIAVSRRSQIDGMHSDLSEQFADPSEASKSSTPVIQFKPVKPEKETVTVWLDTQHPQWDTGAYTGFVETLKIYCLDKQIMRSVNLDS